MLATKVCKQRRRFSAHQQQTALMPTLGQPPNDGPVARVSIAVPPVALARLEDCLKVVQHKQAAALAQQVQQHIESGILGLRRRHLLAGDDANGVAQPLSGEGRAAQTTPVQTLETGRQLLRESGGERRFTDAANAKHGDNAAVLVQHPSPQLVQLANATLKVLAARSFSPIRTPSGGCGGSARDQRPRRTWTGAMRDVLRYQFSERGGVEWRAQPRRPAQRRCPYHSGLGGLVPGREGVRHEQCVQQSLETLCSRVVGSRLPPLNRTRMPADARRELSLAQPRSLTQLEQQPLKAFSRQVRRLARHHAPTLRSNRGTRKVAER